MSQKVPVTTQNSNTADTHINKALYNFATQLNSVTTYDIQYFSACERRITEDGTWPAFYQGKGLDYIDLRPNDQMYGYGFFDIQDPERYLDGHRSKGGWKVIERDVALIVFVNLDYLTERAGSTITDYRLAKQQIRDDILKCISRYMTSVQATVVLNAFYDRTISDVFKGFSVDEVNVQYQQLPYYAMRYEMTLTFREACAVTPPQDNISFTVNITNEATQSVTIIAKLTGVCYVNYGDGTILPILSDTTCEAGVNTNTHTYAVKGTYTMLITGDLDTISCLDISNSRIASVVSLANVQTTIVRLRLDGNQLTALDISGFTVLQVLDMNTNTLGVSAVDTIIGYGGHISTMTYLDTSLQTPAAVPTVGIKLAFAAAHPTATLTTD